MNGLDTTRTLIVGTTGSGKTVLAAEQARAALALGHEVIWLTNQCGPIGLSPWIEVVVGVAAAETRLEQLCEEQERRLRILLAEESGHWDESARRESGSQSISVFIDGLYDPHGSLTPYVSSLLHQNRASAISVTITSQRPQPKLEGEGIDEYILVSSGSTPHDGMLSLLPFGDSFLAELPTGGRPFIVRGGPGNPVRVEERTFINR